MRWPAPTERPWALHGKRKRHFSEFSSEAARSDGGGIPAAATPTHGEQARPGGAAGEASTQGERQRRQRASTDSFCVFLFLGEGCGDPLLLLPASHPVCWRGLAEPTPEERGRTAGGRRQHTEGSLQRRTTDRPPSSPEQRTRESLAERRLRMLWRPVEPAELPASPHQSQRATAGGAVWASSADAARLRRRGSGCSAARRSQGAPPAARAQGLAAGICRLLF